MARDRKTGKIMNKFILDACCGGKSMWFNKQHPNAIYIDSRKENPFPEGHKKVRKGFEINPDYIMDFRKLEFPDESFKLVVCDPPHMKTLGKTSHFRKIYGCLNKETWKKDLEKGFKEMFRVLEDKGILILKWNNTEIPHKEVINLSPYEPLFYNIFSSRTKTDKSTRWYCFMKIQNE